MIAYLKGQVFSIDSDEIILDVSGVGYRLLMSPASIDTLKLQQVLEVYVYTNVREDAITLIAFLKQDERRLFSKLVTVTGVGPKMAIAILNTLSPYTLQQAVLQKNTSILTKIPGVGNKTAQRLILELESYLQRSYFGAQESEPVLKSAMNAHADTRSALQNLGYHERIIEEALEALDMQGEEHDTKGEIYWAINWINKKK
ncbi:MAG: Holliday junction branch migration protein RuvA [Bradymonadales bacterium]|jgi:Holliday junction DNA helicase RuvA